MNGVFAFKELECSNCVYFDSEENFCLVLGESVKKDSICDNYEQDEEPEPIKMKNHHRKKHLEE